MDKVIPTAPGVTSADARVVSAVSTCQAKLSLSGSLAPGRRPRTP